MNSFIDLWQSLEFNSSFMEFFNFYKYLLINYGFENVLFYLIMFYITYKILFFIATLFGYFVLIINNLILKIYCYFTNTIYIPVNDFEEMEWYVYKHYKDQYIINELYRGKKIPRYLKKDYADYIGDFDKRRDLK